MPPCGCGRPVSDCVITRRRRSCRRLAPRRTRMIGACRPDLTRRDAGGGVFCKRRGPGDRSDDAPLTSRRRATTHRAARQRPSRRCSSASATVDPTDITAYRAVRRLRGAAQGDRDRPRRGDSRGHRLEAHGPRRRRVSHRTEMGSGRQAVGASALSHLQRRRIRAGHVQGSRAARRRSVRDRRGDDDRRLRDGLRARLPLHSRRISARRRAHPARDRRSRAPTASSATDILGRGVRFDIEIRRGAGAYICGEETAIFNSIEGYRGEPRNKPPFPAQAGLFGLPTVVNNVETLANIPSIVLNGGAAFAKIGTEQSTGTKLFCVSGNVAQPGVYEVPFGKTLRDLVDMAGGVPDGRSLQAILLGGAAGVFVGPERARHAAHVRGRARREGDARVGRHRRVRRHAWIMQADPPPDRLVLPRRVVRPVRPMPRGNRAPGGGAVSNRQRTNARRRSRRRVALLDEVGLAMKDASICGLGQTAYAAIESAIHRVGVSQRSETGSDGRRNAARSAATPDDRDRSNGDARRASITLTIDGQAVTVPEGTTLLDGLPRRSASRFRRSASSRRCTR